ncbi:glycosyltransferase, partial [Ralstonia pseudosolanacearum]|uniref:glycosyltransferase n=1 Tax=Ralstonia pseudosolanacearum TaxID=1310165 RepID=UPI003AAFFC60
MNYLAVLIATRWGSSLGGINVFNTSLASAIAEVLHTQGKCVCFLEEEADSSIDVPVSIELRKFNPDDSDVVNFIKKTLIEDFSAQHAAEIIVLGHDVKTGRLAIDCSNALKADGLTKVQSVTISHMDYVQYAGAKGRDSTEVTRRFNEQRDVVANADVAFAVGPLLQQSFQVARSQSKTRNSRVQMLVPGTPTPEPTALDESGQLRVFISGRLGGEDDVIKNGKLAVLSLADAYEHGLADASATWKSRGALYAFGVDESTDGSDLRKSRDVAKAHFTVEAVGYSNNQEPIFDKLRSCHIALMPSWHEGFGLTGWEALSLGVPLVCSEQSGLAQLLKILRDILPDINLESIESVNLAGAESNGEPSQYDRKLLRDALLRMARDYPRRKRAAFKLAQQLREEFTWERCAGDLLTHLGWILPKSVGWLDRQQAAFSGYEQSAPNKAALIDDAMTRAEEGDGFVDWENICSALNVFSNLGKDAALRDRAILHQKLDKLSSSLNTSLVGSGDFDEECPTRSTGRMDVHWRLMAASASIATNFSQFNSLIKEHLWNEICGDGFLRREFLYYASKFSDEFTNRAEDLARDKFSTFAAYADDIGLQCRVARLTAVHPEFTGVIPPELHRQAFKAEYDVCKELESSPWRASALIEKCPSAAASLLAVGALRKSEHRES